jgi:hypothetical protein
METGGPGTARPTTLTIRSARPGDLLTYAYDVTPERIVGLTRDSFAWNGTIRYNVVAKVPLGSTKSDVGPMLQQLLTERLHLAVWGHAWAWLWPGVSPGLFAILGAAAVVAATTQGPISTVVLIIELTGRD